MLLRVYLTAFVRKPAGWEQLFDTELCKEEADRGLCTCRMHVSVFRVHYTYLILMWQWMQKWLYSILNIDIPVLYGVARVGPGHCCYRIGPIHFLAGWRKRRSWARVSLVSLGLVVYFFVLYIISVSPVCLDYFASNWLARPYSMMHFVEEYVSTKTSCMRVR